ncbi:MAG TPA: alpha-isopropylmalate synthase regulatory domain-containing protein [Spirochaetota bacterium]|jgi:2-isopropylmalate synthase|nr:alpha-isopropylmalate synthase regulatory domain-containing protein [Spirochaetota bacterium]HQO22773.1 alpha-isopropylmalate synthase regulatory domain-containing protein [Spirochaetota bacterium]HQQ24002.1 alpha-isopropylmalate synthase regulatory domain-containing protein [Spirochaetota bacterium]
MLNYEITDATKQLTIARSLSGYSAPFKLIGGYRLIDNGVEPEATIQIEALGKTIHEASNGNGPVDALANVLKKGLTPLFPCLENITLVDYSAKILDSSSGTGTTVLVEITFTDKTKAWKVYASSANINAASFQVIVDGFEYAILNSVR